jgi:hypothetical protein
MGWAEVHQLYVYPTQVQVEFVIEQDLWYGRFPFLEHQVRPDVPGANRYGRIVKLLGPASVTGMIVTEDRVLDRHVVSFFEFGLQPRHCRGAAVMPVNDDNSFIRIGNLHY